MLDTSETFPCNHSKALSTLRTALACASRVLRLHSELFLVGESSRLKAADCSPIGLLAHWLGVITYLLYRAPRLHCMQIGWAYQTMPTYMSIRSNTPPNLRFADHRPRAFFGSAPFTAPVLPRSSTSLIFLLPALPFLSILPASFSFSKTVSTSRLLLPQQDLNTP